MQRPQTGQLWTKSNPEICLVRPAERFKKCLMHCQPLKMSRLYMKFQVSMIYLNIRSSSNTWPSSPHDNSELEFTV